MGDGSPMSMPDPPRQPNATTGGTVENGKNPDGSWSDEALAWFKGVERAKNTESLASNADVLAVYPQFAAYLNHPELGPIIRQAARDGNGAAELEGKLHQTKWWKSTWPAMRSWQFLTQEDPRSAEKEREQAKFEIGQLYHRLGIMHSGADLTYMAEHFLMNGKDEWFLLQSIGRMLKKEPQRLKQSGELQKNIMTVKDIGAQYAVDLDDLTAQTWAIDMFTGHANSDRFTAYAAGEARKRFAPIAEYLDQGMTVRDFLAPAINTVARELELEPNAINLLDPRWSQMLQVKEQGIGTERMMTAEEARVFARTQNEYQHTGNAKDQAAELGQTLLEKMGRI